MGKAQFEQNFVEALGLKANPFEDDFKHIYTNVIYPTLAEKIITDVAPKLGASLAP